MQELFYGEGIAHSILLIALVVGLGLYLGRFKFRGISIGSTWILFVGILAGHLGMRIRPEVLHFVKEFGLILFVFSIGLQVGPGFFHSFRSGGVRLNLLALLNISLTVVCTLSIALLSGEDLRTLIGVMSGAVTNTPGLGAAQQAFSDAAHALSGEGASALSARVTDTMASAYAVAYPVGVVGVIAAIMLLRKALGIDPKAELEAIKANEQRLDGARRMHVAVENPAIFGKKLYGVLQEFGGDFVVSRIMKGEEICFPNADTVLDEGDKLLIVTHESEVNRLRILFGQEVPMHVQQWQERDHHMTTRRIVVTQSSLTGKKLRNLHFRSVYGVTVTRVIRAGVELVAAPDLYLQMGDGLMCVGPKENIEHLAQRVGNSNDALNKPNLVPIFLGIVLGIVLGSIPIAFPGVPQSVKLGLAGGPLVVAILLGHFGPKYKITTYTTTSANLMVREIGISLFLAAVGIGAGGNFWASIVGGGYRWIFHGACITVIPVCVTFLVARLLFKVDFYRICGLLGGSCTNPPVLAFAQEMYGSDYASVHYATVYPLSMFLRVVVAQMLMLFALS